MYSQVPEYMKRKHVYRIFRMLKINLKRQFQTHFYCDFRLTLSRCPPNFFKHIELDED